MVPPVKSPSINLPSHLSAGRIAAADVDADSERETLPEVNSHVIFSIPALNIAGDELFTASQHFDHDGPSANLPLETAPAAVVPISVPEANGLQNFVQGAKQRFIEVAGGSLLWRLFVGSGVAVFIGALTLILLGPNPEQVKSDETVSAVAKLSSVDQGLTTTTAAADDGQASSGNPAVELTVSTSENGDRAVPAEFDDPFTEANQVPAKVTRAMHFADQSSDWDQAEIQPVSHQRVGNQPAWLSGTIDFDED